MTFAVIVTTIFSWFNINSLCIMLLVLCRLIDGKPVPSIRAAFSNKYFLAYFALFLIEALGFFYAHDRSAWGHRMEKNATLVAIPFILCGGPFTDGPGYKKLMSAYCGLLLLASVYCLSVATWQYMQHKDIGVFFYHSLSHAIRENAIFYSVFMIFGLLYLLSSDLDTGPLPPAIKKGMQPFLIVFFILIIILLASKLLLVILFLILIHFFSQKYAVGKNKRVLGLVGVVVLALVILIAVVDNPIKRRYLDMSIEDISIIKKDHFDPGTYFNPLQLRLLEWRFAGEILDEQHAWVLGVSTGDSQDLLDKKYIAANMYRGSPERKDQGYLSYNFHNQYVETLVHSGLLGLCLLLVLCWLWIALAWKWRTLQAIYTIAILLVIFVTESPLIMQHGLFLCSFFPLLLLYSPKKARPGGE